jgi:hypothetical protein
MANLDHITRYLTNLLLFKPFKRCALGIKSTERIVCQKQHQLRWKAKYRTRESQFHGAIKMDILKKRFERPVFRGGTV